MAKVATLKAKGSAILETQLADLFKKVNIQIPESGKQTLVKIIPWVDLVLLILLLPAVLAIFALGSLIGGLAVATGVSTGPIYWLALVFLVVQVALMAAALPGLFKLRRQGWVLMYYGTLIGVGYNLFDWVRTPAAFFGLVWGLGVSAVSLWLIFQVCDHYR